MLFSDLRSTIERTTLKLRVLHLGTGANVVPHTYRQLTVTLVTLCNQKPPPFYA
jgi:hypothetical protein